MIRLTTFARAASIVAACSAIAPAARAQPGSAQEDGAPTAEDRQAAAREFGEGQRAFAAGDYKLAAEQFEAAYKHKPHHASLWNAARARQRAGDIARAANLYARYLHDAPASARDRNTAQSSLRQLAPKLGQLEITSVGLEDVRVDREPILDRVVYVNPGAHVVEAKVPPQAAKPGEKPVVTQSVTVEAAQTVSVALVATADKPTTTPPPPPPPPPPPQEKATHGLPPAVFWVGVALTVVGAGATTASGLDTLNQRSEFDKDPTTANLDSGKSKQQRTNILLVLTAGTAVLTSACAVWLVDWRGADRSVQVGASIGSLTLRGTF